MKAMDYPMDMDILMDIYPILNIISIMCVRHMFEYLIKSVLSCIYYYLLYSTLIEMYEWIKCVKQLLQQQNSFGFYNVSIEITKQAYKQMCLNIYTICTYIIYIYFF